MPLNFSNISADQWKPFGSATFAYLSSVAIAITGIWIAEKWSVLLASIAIIGILFMVASIRDFRIVAATIVFFLPYVPTFLTSKESTGISGLRIVTGLLCLLLISISFAAVLRPKHVVLPRLPGIFVIYCLLLTCSAVHGAFSVGEIPEYFVALGVIKSNEVSQYLQNSLLIPLLILAATVAAATLSANVYHFRWTTIPFLLCVISLSLFLAGYAYSSGASILEMAGQESRRYLSGTGYHANEIGLLMNTAFSISLATCLYNRTQSFRLIFLIATLVSLSAVFLTFSRGAYIGTCTVCIYLVLTSKARRLAIPISAMLLVFLMLIPQSMVDRTAVVDGKNNADAVSSGRLEEIWKPLLSDIAEHPIFGNGSESILWSNAAKARNILPVGHPHNAYVAALLDVGVFGLMVIAVFIFHLWQTLWKARDALGDEISKGFFTGAAACIPVLLIQGLTDDSFMPRYTQCFLWLAYGTALGINSRQVSDLSEPTPPY
jgi:hypothetical protein